MPGKNKDRARVIIRRVEDEDHQHGSHGGAWKIAYADFVTAMMAFFLLMWLLNSSDEKKLEGISEYFAPTNSIMGGLGGSGALAGVSPSSKGVLSNGGAIPSSDIKDVPSAVDDAWSRLAQGLDTEQREEIPEPSEDDTGLSDVQARDVEEMRKAQTELEAEIRSNPDLAGLAENISFERTEDGLLIQVMDRQGQPMFTSGRADFETSIATLILKVGAAIKGRPNPILITGHTDAIRFALNKTYSNWELSADRANATRRLLMEGGVAPSRFARVSGMAATDPIIPENPEHPSNRRITIHLLFLD